MPFFSTFMVLAQLSAPSPAQVSIVFGGDVIPHEPVKFVARAHERLDAEGHSTNAGGWDHVFGPLAEVFKRHDVAVVNLESPVVELAHPETGEMVFHAPAAMLKGLKRAGVTVATFANNHCLDQHREGIVATRDALRAAGLESAGAAANEDAAWEPLIIERRGVVIALFAVTRWLNGFQNVKSASQPHVPIVPYPKDPVRGGHSREALATLVSAWSSKVDVVLVSIHWGEEYQSKPTAEDRAFAQQLLDAGATAVIGHHPHVLQPVEWLERRDGTKGLVAFSLGNLVSNQDFDDPAGTKRDGLLLQLTIEKSASERAQLKDVSGVAVGTENRLGRGRERNVQPVLLDDEVLAIEQRLELLATRHDAEALVERKALSRKLTLARQRLERIHSVLGPATTLAGLSTQK